LRHVHSDLVAKLEAVSQGLLGAVDFDWHSIDQMLLDAGFVCFIILSGGGSIARE